MSWKNTVIESLESIYTEKIELISVSPVGGGDINDAFRLITSEGDFFVKKNSSSGFPGMFKKEAMGLELLDRTKAIRVPKVIDFGESGDEAFLILRFIRSGQRKPIFWDQFAHQLGNLHRHSNDSFGLDHNNYIGSLHQSNKKHKTWHEFFVSERLEVQVKLARNSGLIDKNTISAFEKFYKKINDIFTVEQPALLHGDLWGGNFMVDENGGPVLIDPAVYYGHREMDLAMTKLFGGFDSKFYDAYNQYYPLEKAWQERVDYCNLYPLMVHVNLFGKTYLRSVNSILNKFY